MIKRIVGRCHVGDELESVIRYTISRLADKFEGYRSMDTETKALFVKTIIDAHRANRDLYSFVTGGIDFA